MSVSEKIDPRLLSLRDYAPYFSAQEVYGIPVSPLHIGKLNVTSGHIVAADPVMNLDVRKPFTKKIPPGQYDVVISVAETDSWGKSHAAVMVKFSENPALCWEMAMTENNAIEELTDPGDFFGYPVGAGMGCFCDQEAQNLFNIFEAELQAKDCDLYNDFFEDELDKNGDRGWLNFNVPGSDKHNIVVFDSGLGDGFYPCYWGIDADGAICSMVVDFQILHPKEEE